MENHDESIIICGFFVLNNAFSLVNLLLFVGYIPIVHLSCSCPEEILMHLLSAFTIMFVQWEFQDPKVEVLYHIRPYFVGIFPYIGLI